MKRSLLEIYALAACFAAVMFLVVNVATCLYQVVRIAAPSVTVASHQYERSMSDQEFMRYWPDSLPKPEPAKLPELRQEALTSALRSERHNAVGSFLEALMYVLAAGPAFWFHWRLARRERTRTAVDPS